MRISLTLPALLLFSLAHAQSPTFHEGRRAFPESDLWAVRQAALFDQDGDSDMDAIAFTVGFPDANAQFARNDGSGRFVDVGADLPPIAGSVLDVCAFEADGDGRDDLAVTFQVGSASTRLEVWLSRGTRLVAREPANQAPVFPSLVTRMTPGDFDGDGDQDLVTVSGSFQNSFVRLFRNDGTGRLVLDPTAFPNVSVDSRDVDVADVDGDQDLDVFVSTYLVSRLFLNDGTGAFTEAPSGAFPSMTLDACFLDADGDSDLDILSTSPLMLFVNNGFGRFFARPGALPTDFMGSNARPGDFDGDGDVDVVYGFHDSLRLAVNEGNGTFQIRVQNLPHLALTNVLEVADLDADSDLDVLHVDGERPALSLNDGTGHFELVTSDRPDGFRRRGGQLRCADLNGDSWLDVALVGNLDVRIHFATLPGVYDDTNVTVLTSPDPIQRILLVDVDGDLDLDVVALAGLSAVNPRRDRLYRNDGNGTFVDVTQSQMPAEPTFAVLGEAGDLDGDGDLDLWLSEEGTQIFVENDGTGTFVHRSLITTVSDPVSDVLLGDVDGDHDLDAILVTRGIDRLYRNVGGSFQLDPVAIAPEPQSESRGALFDFDGDQDLDLFVGASRYGMPLERSRMYENDGSGRFTRLQAPVFDGTADHVFSLAAGDFDGDGRDDLFVFNLWEVPNAPDSYLLTRPVGSASFQVLEPVSPYRRPTVASAIPADVDLDGDLDLVLSLRDSSSTHVVFQRTRATIAALPSRLGKRQTLEIHGEANASYLLGASLGSASIDLGAIGTFLLDPSTFVAVRSTFLQANGSGLVTFQVPSDPSAVGRSIYWQSLIVGTEVRLTNLLVDTFRAL